MKGCVMKKLIIYITIFSMLNLVGCYTHIHIPDDEYSNKLADLDEVLHIKLTDGRTIISKEYEHIEVKEPSEFVVGKADIIYERSLKRNVNIILYNVQIDSIEMKYADNKGFVCWSKGNRYHFKNQEYFYITYDSIPGLYVRGTIAESDAIFFGRLEPRDIAAIEVVEIDPVNTSLFTAGVVLVGFLVIGAIVFASKPIFKGGFKL
jgi:hypothetical protein